MKLDLDNDNIFQAEVTTEVVRKFFDGSDLPEDIMLAFDEAQGYVFTRSARDKTIAYIVIKVIRDAKTD